MKHLFLLVVGALALLVPAVGHAGGAPAIAFDPSSHNFGEIGVDATPATEEFTLRNAGTKATGALKVSLSPDSSSAFSIIDVSCTAVSLGPRKSCSVTVQYDPTSAGQSDSATLTARSKKPAASASASLTGASTPAGTADLTISPGQYVLGTTEPEQFLFSFGLVASQTQTFTVTNTGSGASDTLLVSGATHPNFARTGDSCSGQVLAPEGSCAFDITYTAPVGCVSGAPVDPAVFDVFGVSGPPHYIHLRVVANCP